MRIKSTAIPMLLVISALGLAAVGCASDKPMLGQQVGSFTDDAYLTSAVKTKLLGDTGLKAFSIHVVTKDQVVTLSGDLPTQALVDEAVRTAKSVGGVKEVVSQLEVKSQ